MQISSATMHGNVSCIKKVFAYEKQNNNKKRVIFNTIHWVDFWWFRDIFVPLQAIRRNHKIDNQEI